MWKNILKDIKFQIARGQIWQLRPNYKENKIPNGWRVDPDKVGERNVCND